MTERFVSKFSLIRGTEIPVLEGGVPSFLGVPVARTSADLAGADAAIIGIPYDRQATARRGASDWAGYREASRAARGSSGPSARPSPRRCARPRPATSSCATSHSRSCAACHR